MLRPGTWLKVRKSISKGQVTIFDYYSKCYFMRVLWNRIYQRDEMGKWPTLIMCCNQMNYSEHTSIYRLF